MRFGHVVSTSSESVSSIRSPLAVSKPDEFISLAVGSALGSINNLFSKVKAINAKHGPFELLLCTGDFFGPPGAANESEEVDALLNGKLEGE